MQALPSASSRRPIHWLLLSLGIVALGLSALSLLLSETTQITVFSESGPFEIASGPLWLALGVLILIVLRPVTPATVSGAIICAACAAREADLHKHFTSESMLKIGFYHDPAHPVLQRVLFGVLMVILTGSMVLVVGALVRRVREGDKPFQSWILYAIIAMGTLVLTKVLDRTPNILDDATGFVFPENLRGVLRAWEEGFEMLLPVMFGIVVLAYAHARRRGSGAAGG